MDSLTERLEALAAAVDVARSTVSAIKRGEHETFFSVDFGPKTVEITGLKAMVDSIRFIASGLSENAPL